MVIGNSSSVSVRLVNYCLLGSLFDPSVYLGITLPDIAFLKLPSASLIMYPVILIGDH